MMDERPMGIVVTIVGLIGLLLSLFADPLGIGEGEVFGWLQITGTIISAIVTLLGLALAMEWVPYPARRDDTVAAGSQNTTVVSERAPRDPVTGEPTTRDTTP